MKKLISATALALLSVTANAQLNWQKGGNSTFPIGSPSTLGTNYNAPLGFLTNGVQRMILTTTDELNMVAPSAAFQINSQNILWHKGEIRNLFVGVNAGANNLGGNAFQNTFIGNNAGFANITGQRNTFLGASAGESIKAGNWNTFIGTEAGKNLLTGEHNIS